MSKEITVQSSVTVKQSPDLKSIQQKAVAGLSEAELVRRHTIGEYNNNEEEEDQEDKEKNREETTA